MVEHECLRCGKCCLYLSMQVSVPQGDIDMWIQAGRDDILAWVSNSGPGYDIWINPYTGDEHDYGCPWLRRDNNNRLSCSIYEVRPTPCREYGPDEHAINTKCTYHTGEPFIPEADVLACVPLSGDWEDYEITINLRLPNRNGLPNHSVGDYVQYLIDNDSELLEDLLEVHSIEDVQQIFKTALVFSVDTRID